MFECSLALFGLIFGPKSGAIQVRPPEMYVTEGKLIRESTWITRCIYRRSCVAVIGTIGREHFVFVGMHACHTNRVFNRIGTGISKEDLCKVGTGYFNNTLSRFIARIICMLRRNGCEYFGLGLNRLNNFRVLVADICKDKLR